MTAAPDTCIHSRKAVPFYRQRTWYWQELREGRLADETPIVRGKSCHWARYAAGEWKARVRAAMSSYKRWYNYHWRWRKWLPANWLAVAICETGQNPPNWEHDSGTYVSAFGIYRPGYVDDAHRIGQLSWDETIRKLKRLPTPREQYEAALSHYRQHGDGWGCPGP